MHTKCASGLIAVASDGLFAIVGLGSQVPSTALSLEALVALEVLTHFDDLQVCDEEYARVLSRDPVSTDASFLGIEKVLSGGNRWILILNRTLRIVDATGAVIADITALSAKTNYVFYSIGVRRGLALNKPCIRFEGALKQLETFGLVTPETGRVDWGDLRRALPICPRFGASRGTPVDRYYLGLFVKQIRKEVVGDVLEIGGRGFNQQLYGFHSAKRYRGMDLAPGTGVDIIGDAQYSTTISENSLETVIAFNVLEHCSNPTATVSSMKRWLKRGGKAFCAVPSIQRVHKMPDDYCRLLPSGLDLLFRHWSERRVCAFGNPTTSVAALLGMAAEELTPEELTTNHPDYPVLTCVTATK